MGHYRLLNKLLIEESSEENIKEIVKYQEKIIYN